MFKVKVTGDEVEVEATLLSASGMPDGDLVSEDVGFLVEQIGEPESVPTVARVSGGGSTLAEARRSKLTLWRARYRRK